MTQRLDTRWLLVTLVLAPLSGCAAPRPHATAAPNPRWTYVEGAPVRGDRSEAALALVFTGGEYGEGTGFILDALRTAAVPASFFVTGQYLAKEEHCALVRRMLAEGHYVGPHSQGHLLYCAWDDRGRTLVSRQEFRTDLEQNIAALRELGAFPDRPRAASRPARKGSVDDGPPRGRTGREAAADENSSRGESRRTAPAVYFIPPYEWYNADQTAWAREMGVQLFNFTPGSGSNRDWIPETDSRFVPSAEIARDILEFEQRAPDGLNGFVLLLHLGSQRTDKMHPQVPRILKGLKLRGYRFVRVDELFAG